MAKLLGNLLCLRFRHAENLAQREHDVIEDSKMRKGVPLLEHDADAAAQFVEVG